MSGHPPSISAIEHPLRRASQLIASALGGGRRPSQISLNHQRLTDATGGADLGHLPADVERIDQA